MRCIAKLGILGVAMSAVTATMTVGCARPLLRTEGTTSGIRAAEEVGAADVPRAALHLQLAKEELEHAKALFAKGEKEIAASLLMRSEADAELAVALAREDAEKTEARAAVDRVRKLREDNR